MFNVTLNARECGRGIVIGLVRQFIYRIVWFLSACAYLENSKKYAPKSQVR